MRLAILILVRPAMKLTYSPLSTDLRHPTVCVPVLTTVLDLHLPSREICPTCAKLYLDYANRFWFAS